MIGKASTKSIMHIRLSRIIILIIFTVQTTTSAFTHVTVLKHDNNEVYDPNLPDLSHQHLAVHAAQSHGNSSEQVDWIAQGAYNEDHQLIPTFGWHSWDPDTGGYWWSPTGDGPAIERANQLFLEAVGIYNTDHQQAWIVFGQSLHLLQDLSTPAHAHADSHVCIAGIGDCDAYETWLGEDELLNTLYWINSNPPSNLYDMNYSHIPKWNDLSVDIKDQLEGAYTEYGDRTSAQQLWELGPFGIEPILFQLMFLMAESADNYNSGGIVEFTGEYYNGDLDNPDYLISMRDELFSKAIIFSTAWIDYFEYQIGYPDSILFLPMIVGQ